MHIDFDWNSINIDSEQRREIEKNITKEIVRLIKSLPTKSKLRVALYGDKLQFSLAGIATNANGDVLVKITYLLIPPHTATYEPVEQDSMS